jgi:hypothetical protein
MPAIFRNGEIVVDTMPEPRAAAGQVPVKTLAAAFAARTLHARKHAHGVLKPGAAGARNVR